MFYFVADLRLRGHAGRFILHVTCHHMIDTLRQVQVMNGKVYFGIFHGADVINGELSVALHMAYLKAHTGPGTVHASHCDVFDSWQFQKQGALR